MKRKKEDRRGHSSGCLAHLAALNAVGAALAALFADETTAQSGQTMEELYELARCIARILNFNLPSAEAAPVFAALLLRLRLRLLVLHLGRWSVEDLCDTRRLNTYTTGRRGATVALLGRISLGRISLLGVAVLAGGRTVTGLLVAVFNPSQISNNPKEPSASNDTLPVQLDHQCDQAAV
jgi:hypothetical protein